MKALCDSFLPREEVALERQINARSHVGLDFTQRPFGETDDEAEFPASFLVLADRARKEIKHIAVERHIFARHRYVGIKKLLDMCEHKNDRADAVLDFCPRPFPWCERNFCWRRRRHFRSSGDC